MATILLVEDDPLQAFVRISALEKKFHDVQRAADPAEALGMIELPQFASSLGLIITDLHMPGFKGAEFVAELRTRLPTVPVLVLEDAPETALTFASRDVGFVPRSAPEEMLTAAAQLLGAHERY